MECKWDAVITPYHQYHSPCSKSSICKRRQSNCQSRESRNDNLTSKNIIRKRSKVNNHNNNYYLTFSLASRQMQLHTSLVKQMSSRRDCINLIQSIYHLIILNLIMSMVISVNAEFDPFNNDLLSLSGHQKDGSQKVSKCDACRLLVKSFQTGIDKTARGKHEGGDTSWEEKNLKSYADSEVRLIEIQEQLCEGIKSGKADCLSLAEETEPDVEEWWFKQRRKNVDLDDFLCISRLKHCCANGKFGPTCQPCPSDCSQHGKCDGSGTRSGSGNCVCDEGYDGEKCENCNDNYFRLQTNSDDFTCAQCHSACIGCYGFGPLNCTNCRPGYKKNENKGCVDIDECVEGIDRDGNTKICKQNTFCVNTEGSYRCSDCHISCNGCIGYGSNLCIECAKDYELDDEFVCHSKAEMDRLRKEEGFMHSNDIFARYMVYLMILVVSSLMFRSNVFFLCSFIIGFLIFCTLNEFNITE